jgi:hypothetical protein
MAAPPTQTSLCISIAIFRSSDARGSNVPKSHPHRSPDKIETVVKKIKWPGRGWEAKWALEERRVIFQTHPSRVMPSPEPIILHDRRPNANIINPNTIPVVRAGGGRWMVVQ